MPKPSAQAQIRKLHRQLRDTGAVANDYAQKITALNAALTRSNQTRAGLMRMVIVRDMEAARLAGYIDRVRETDGKPDDQEAAASPAIRKMPDGLSTEALINMSDAEFRETVDRMPRSRLDQLLGRPDAEGEY